MKNILLIVSLLSFISADIYISGDARVRPRLDDIKNGDKSESSDLYYLYRARLNVKADIGEGYFFNAKLGTNDIAAISKMGNDGNFTSGSGNVNSARPQVDFLDIYYGFQKQNSGLWAGAFPLKHNPALDIHFYPSKIVDIPWILYNNSTVTGFAGYQKVMNYKLNWFLSVDNNVENTLKVPEKTVEAKDTYTLGFNTSIDVGPISITPRFLYTLADTTQNAPMTFGGGLILPEIIGFGSSISYYMSSNSNVNKYNVNHIRLKLGGKVGPGVLSFFYDMASNKPIGSTQMDLDYLWLSYKYNYYKGELGSITLKPTVRIQTGSISDKDYSRTKFELTTEIKFK